jgi:[acyl-carrier-protein] S-malonyltransferase
LSLGEYTALHFAGALRFEDGLRLVAARGAAMQAACEARRGTMISVLGLTRPQVEAALVGHEAWVTNVNAPDQVVVGGPVEAVDAAAEALRSSGARRVVPLQVVGAYHTPLMKPAESALAGRLTAIRFSPPCVPVWSNVTGAPVPGPAGIGDLLLRQLTAPVLWSPIIEGMVASGVRRVYEVGCGNVLAGLLRRIARDVPCTVLESPADLSALTGTA